MTTRPVKDSSSRQQSSPEVGRRGIVAGAAVAGAAAVAAAALQRGTALGPSQVAQKTVQEKGDGYQVTPHVLRYYETTRA